MFERKELRDGSSEGVEAVNPKVDSLRLWFKHKGSIIVAYSGGVDSSLLLAIGSQELGDRCIGMIGISPSLSGAERDNAMAFAVHIGAKVIKVPTKELDAEGYASNRGDRCYHCKNDLFSHLRTLASIMEVEIIVDGTNLDDLKEDRPGLRAAREHGVRSPLMECGLNKEDVRLAARTLDLKIWDKPSMACLASRIPQGTRITIELLNRTEESESVLRHLGFQQFRVRHNGEVARIELPQEDMDRALALRNDIVEGLISIGYRFICLDLAGLRGTPRH